jgi:hypothetical protein
MSSDSSFDLWFTIIGLIICCCIILSFNMCTADEWNGGECPRCDTRYELRGASRGIKYYACPKCGNEVSRYYIGA